MSDLEQRLADQLDTVGRELTTPYVDAAGLAAAGRRETVRRRAVTGVLAGAAAVVLAVGLVSALPRGGSDEPAPAGPSTATDDDLGRPLELPWWGTDEGTLQAGDDRIPAADATAVMHRAGVTLVERGAGRWWRVDRGSLVPISQTRLPAAPVIADGGVMAYVLADGPNGFALIREDDGEGSGESLDLAVRPEVVGVTGDQVLVRVGDGLWVRSDDFPGLRSVTGIPPYSGGLAYEPRPTGVALRTPGTVVAAEVRGTRIRMLWETPTDGPGVWSDDGEQYADLTEDGVRFATRAGRTVAPLASVTDLRVVGWESDTEVVVAQWIPEDEAVVGLWRCSSAQLQCAEVADAPNGRILLPGLLG